MKELDVKLEGADRVLLALDAPATKARSFRPAFKDIREEVAIPLVHYQFQTQGALDGGWKGLNPVYEAEKKKKHPGKTTLRRKDRLYKSLTNVRNRNFIWKTSPTQAMWGSRIPYAIYHQKPRRAGRPPRRRIIVLKGRFASQATLRLSKYLTQRARRNSRRNKRGNPS